jgi:hypothetical protein
MKHGMITKDIVYEIGSNVLISSDKKYSWTFMVKTSGPHKGLFINFYRGLKGFEFNIYSIHH